MKRTLICISLLCFSVLPMISCASKVLKFDKPETLQVHQEFEQTVKIEEVSAPAAEPAVAPPQVLTKAKASKKTKSKKTTEASVEKSERRQPEIESDLGFAPGSRRPLKDPFEVGETVVHSVRYFKVNAASLTFSVKPHVNVNSKKSYRFITAIKTSSLFSSFYAVDDEVETLVDFESLLPNVFELHVKETGQIREARSYFDFSQMKAKFWENKVTEKSGKEEKKLEWDLAPFSQNVFSAIFYLRNFQWDVGTENAFMVSDDGKNLVFKAKGIRREKLDTDAGEFNAIVIQPQVTLKEKFQPIGDVFIWLSDDEHKYILRIEAKIKIGTLVSEVVEIRPSQP